LESGKVMKEVAGEGISFTFYGPIFGAEPWRQGRFVHSFGLPSGFQGFCGTVKDMSLMGLTYNGSVGTPHVTPLPMISTDGVWYETVIKANMHRNVIFLRPSRQYSPISNVVIPPTKGVKFATRGVELAYAEQGDADDIYDDVEASDEYVYPAADYSAEEEDAGSGGEGDDDDLEEEEEFFETTASPHTTTTEHVPVSVQPQLVPTLISAMRPAESPKGTKKVSYAEDAKDIMVGSQGLLAGPVATTSPPVPLGPPPLPPPKRRSDQLAKGPDAMTPSSATTSDPPSASVSTTTKRTVRSKAQARESTQAVTTDPDMGVFDLDPSLL